MLSGFQDFPEPREGLRKNRAHGRDFVDELLAKDSKPGTMDRRYSPATAAQAGQNSGCFKSIPSAECEELMTQR